jgi:hypothetical protein
LLILTLDIRNDGFNPLELYGVRGALWFGPRRWQESEPRGRGLVVPSQQTRPLTLAVPLLAQPALPADSLRRLQQALRQGDLDPQQLGLRVKTDVRGNGGNNYLFDQDGTLLPLPALAPGR